MLDYFSDFLNAEDEKWSIYGNNKKRRQWLKIEQPTSKAGLHTQKRMFSIWWCLKGVIYWELLPENITVNAIKYCAQLNKLESEVVKQELSNGKIYFQHGDAKLHIAQTV